MSSSFSFPKFSLTKTPTSEPEILIFESVCGKIHIYEEISQINYEIATIEIDVAKNMLSFVGSFMNDSKNNPRCIKIQDPLSNNAIHELMRSLIQWSIEEHNATVVILEPQLYAMRFPPSPIVMFREIPNVVEVQIELQRMLQVLWKIELCSMK